MHRDIVEWLYGAAQDMTLMEFATLVQALAGGVGGLSGVAPYAAGQLPAWAKSNDRATGQRREALAVCDRTGVLRFTDTLFSAVMRAEWPLFSEVQLPEALLHSLLARGRYTGEQIAVYALAASEAALFLKARVKLAVDILSGREYAVALLFARSLSHKGIARTLSISPATVRAYLQSAYVKLGVHNKAELAAMFAPSSEASSAGIRGREQGPAR